MSPGAVQALVSTRKSSLLDFAIESSFSVPMPVHGSVPHFGFMANTPLSGGPSPCSEIDCRIARVDTLARFTALYADHVAIRNPFADYTPGMPVSILRQRLAGDMAVMLRLEPLVRAGLVTVTPPVVAMCARCSAIFAAQHDSLSEAIDSAADRLLEQYMSRVVVKREPSGCVGVYGPEEFIVHGAQFFQTPPESVFSGRLTRGRKERLVRALISPLLEDVYRHHVHSRHTGFNYLTDRELDLTVIRSVGGPAVKPIDRALMRGLSHTLPVVMRMPIQEILRLREEEAESFAVYRHAISSIVREADLTTKDAIEEAFQSKVMPEIAKIDLAVKNAQKIAGRGIKHEIGISAAAVSIGMLVGTVQPTIGAVLAALGGLGAVKTIVEKAVVASSPPPVIRENSFYFLWQLQRPKQGKLQVATRP
jgi:hypothetical protein